jgi:seryl-tRNA(Sec) selenium transferase
MKPGTILTSVMYVNNEIGVVQDISRIGELCRSRGVILHVDAAQATGKVEIDLEKTKVDLMSFSAHKTYGPKGIGALFVRRKPRIRIEAQIHGGGHERGMRSGTLAVHQIVGMGEAFRIARVEMVEENARIRALRDRLLSGLKDIEEVYVNGDMDQRVPHNLNISFNYVEGESSPKKRISPLPRQTSCCENTKPSSRRCGSSLRTPDLIPCSFAGWTPASTARRPGSIAIARSTKSTLKTVSHMKSGKCPPRR